MELRVLRYFLAIAREENMTKAASVLHLTQPTLSRQIHQLEQELGTTLFIRNGHHIFLTASGMRLKQRAQDLVELADRTEAEMKQKEEIIAREISLGIGETVNMVFLSRVMRSLQARYPDVVFSVYTAIADDVICRLDQGLLDFGVLIEPVDITRYQFLELPKKDRWTALLPKAHPLAQKEALTPKDLSQERLITAERKSVQNLIDNWLGAYGNRCTSMNRMNLSLFNKCVMVEQGLGIALGLDFPYVPEGLLMKPLDPPIENRSYLVWKKGPLLSPVLGRFTDEVRRFLSQEAEDE